MAYLYTVVDEKTIVVADNKELNLPLSKGILEQLDWMFSQTNHIVSWYRKNDLHFKDPVYSHYTIWHAELMHDPEHKCVKIRYQFNDAEWYTMFEGYCPDLRTLLTIQSLIRLQDGIEGVDLRIGGEEKEDQRIQTYPEDPTDRRRPGSSLGYSSQ